MFEVRLSKLPLLLSAHCDKLQEEKASRVFFYSMVDPSPSSVYLGRHSLVLRHSSFRTHPAALSKNRVWTLSLNWDIIIRAYQHVVAPIRFLR